MANVPRDPRLSKDGTVLLFVDPRARLQNDTPTEFKNAPVSSKLGTTCLGRGVRVVNWLAAPLELNQH